MYKVTCDKYEVVTKAKYKMELYISEFLLENKVVVIEKLRRMNKSEEDIVKVKNNENINKMDCPKKFKVICEEGTSTTEDVYDMEMFVSGLLLDNEKVTVLRLD